MPPTRDTSPNPANGAGEVPEPSSKWEWEPLAYARSRLRPMAPLPTGVSPRLPRQEGVRAILFDIYGTLLVSAAGEAGSDRRERGATAMEQLLPSLKGGSAASSSPILPASSPPRREAEEWLDRYEGILARRLDQVSASGEPHPEVDIRAVWTELLANHSASSRSGGSGGSARSGEPLASQAEELALRFECEANPCAEMPGASRLLLQLRDCGICLGVVSNAQFYTAPVFEAALGHPLKNGVFEEDLAFYSWLEGCGKPSPALFERAREALDRRGIAPGETLLVGNDLVKDVLPAAAAGFRTALFAGDARSLRCGNGTPDEAGRYADLVLTKLGQIAEVLGL